jgi:hypothetical protein
MVSVVWAFKVVPKERNKTKKNMLLRMNQILCKEIKTSVMVDYLNIN